MQEEKDLFSVQLNEKGVESVLRIYRIVKFCFWTGVVINLVMLYTPVHAIITYWSVVKSSAVFSTRLLILLGYMLLFSIVYFLQFFFFLKFINRAKKGIELNDSVTFNQSLSRMYKAFWMTALGIILNGLYAVYVLLGYETLY